jgi:hypothetical protein
MQRVGVRLLGGALLAVLDVLFNLHQLRLKGDEQRANKHEYYFGAQESNKNTSRIIQCASRRLRTFTRSPEGRERTREGEGEGEGESRWKSKDRRKKMSLGGRALFASSSGCVITRLFEMGKTVDCGGVSAIRKGVNEENEISSDQCSR